MVALPVASLLPLAAALGAVATRGARALAARLRIVSPIDPFVPQHTRPVALLGGSAVAVAAGATIALDADGAALGRATAVGALLFIGIGLADDLRALGPAQKLALQTLAASIAAALGATFTATGQHPLDAMLSVVCIVTLVNAVNVTDVCDGLVAGVAVIALVALGLTEASTRASCLAVAGACVGFLVFNAPPASIFLGDAGSSFLGFFLAAQLLRTVDDKGVGTGGVRAVLFVAVPLFDLAFVVLARTLRHERWWRGSGDHFALRLQAAGLSRWQTDAVAWSAAATLALVGSLFARLAAPARTSLLVLVVGAVAAASGLLLRLESTAAE